MSRAAVLGDPIEHSLSPLLHRAGYHALGLADWRYSAIRCPAGRLAETVAGADPAFRGFSVTMPGKFEALQFATQKTPRAVAVGSANTLVRVPGGWRADNTDVDGVHGALDELGGPIARREARRAVVLGAGGTARAAIFALGERGVREIAVVNRSDKTAGLAGLAPAAGLSFVRWDADLRALVAGADVLVSTVPAGVVDAYAQDLGHLPVLDVIYRPWPTALCAASAANGYLTAGGRVMLAWQAYSQFEQFTGCVAPREAMRQAIDRAP
ncbi:shikimate dehydrogenase [Corynebacterium atypicum]|uniref:shikimate dehydrogenase (NADP(+)) n=1 Tax=Corynebacterium atypicum TaxID=191610 RepID=A0ABM5QMQ4_9CORY|nr:shikimate dehydrogenase [Corynebacterium atypicum]AIG64064.1 shikimate dehydrogenase [Corynebacterium atypicum]